LLYQYKSTNTDAHTCQLLAALFKELGWGVGYEIRERQYILDEKIKQPFQKDMLVCLRFGLEGLVTSSKVLNLLALLVQKYKH
jgi:nucleosome binding factor SPN SPT16 subunit